MVYLVSKVLKLFPEKGIIIDNNVDRLYAWAESKEWIGLDTETSGLNFWDGQLFTIQFGDWDNQFVIDLKTIAITDLLPLFSSKKFILQNAKFDWKWLRHHGIELGEVYDTFLAEKILTCGLNKRLGLDVIAWDYCQFKLDKSDRGLMSYMGLTPRTIIYAAHDVKCLEIIREKQLNKIQELELKNVEELEMEVLHIIAEMEYYGFKLDVNLWKQLIAKNEVLLDKIAQELDNIVFNEPKLKSFQKKYIQTKLFDIQDDVVNINYNSPIQLLKVFKSLGYDLNNVDDEALSGIDIPFANKILEYRSYSKLLGTYGKNFLALLRDDNIISTDYTQIVNTGRMASKTPNLQNIPREQDYRTPFSGEDGEWLVCADYSGIELVLVIEDSKETSWVEAQNNGYDLHSINGKMTFDQEWIKETLKDCQFEIDKKQCECPAHKKMRNATKTVTYASLYGATGEKIAKTLKIPKVEGEKILKKYYNALPSLNKWMEDVKRYAINFLQIRSFRPYRRIRFFEMPESGYTGDIERQSINTRIQGTAADCMKLALVLCKRKLLAMNIPHKFRGVVHDEMIVSFPDREIAEIGAKIIHEQMMEAGKVLTKTVKLDCTVKISKHWLK